MKNLLRLSMICIVLALSGCSKSDVSGETIKLEIPLLQEDGTYSLEVVEVPRPKSMETLESDFAKFRFYTREEQLDVDTNGRWVVGGEEPKFQFIKRGDVFVPSGQIESLEAATSYYWIWKIKNLMTDLGWEFADFWPRTVVFHNTGKKNNAFYSLLGDYFGVTEYSLSQVPASMNGEVWAHEFFHAINIHMFAKKYAGETPEYTPLYEFLDYIYQDKTGKYESTSPFMEGFADIFSFIVTGNDSLMSNFHSEKRKVEQRNLPSKVQVYSPYSDQNFNLKEHTYLQGTFYAQSFIHTELNARKWEFERLKSLNAEDKISFLQSVYDFMYTKVYDEVFTKANSKVSQGVSILNDYRSERLGVDTSFYKEVDEKSVKEAAEDDFIEDLNRNKSKQSRGLNHEH